MSRIDTVIEEPAFVWCVNQLPWSDAEKKLLLYMLGILPKNDPDYDEVARSLDCLLVGLEWNCRDEDLLERRSLVAEARNHFRLSETWLPGILGVMYLVMGSRVAVPGSRGLTIADCVAIATYGVQPVFLKETFFEARVLAEMWRMKLGEMLGR